MARKTHTLGFTLIELLVTLAVLVILASIAAPNFARVIAENRTTSAANEFLAMLQTARSEAVRLNRTVDVTQSGGNWHSGLNVVAPVNNTLRSMPAMAQGLTLTGPTPPLTFRPAGDTTAANFQLTNTAGLTPAPTRCIRVELTGTARVERGACQP